MNKFSHRLRHARQLRNLTQSELAQAAGLTQGAIANYEGESRQSSKAIFKLASALRVHAEWLSQGTGPMETDDAHASGNPYPSKSSGYPYASVWPFQDISPDDYWSLSGENRVLVENTLAALVTSLQKKPPADKS